MANKQKNILILVGIIIVAISAFVYFINGSTIVEFISSPFKGYLKSQLQLAAGIYDLLGEPLEVNELTVFFSDGSLLAFDTGYLMKKWLLGLLLLIWVTPAKNIIKVKASLVFLVIQAAVIQLLILVSLWFYNLGYIADDSKNIAQAISIVFLFSFAVFWINSNKNILEFIRSKLNLPQDYFLRKYNTLLKLMYLLFGLELILAIFSFELWIHIIFSTTHNVLNLLGYESIVEPFYLLGEYANIYMAKGCLGIKTSYLFAGFVILTGENLLLKSKYILAGVVIINLANILRFVALFIHLQNHGEYRWGMEVHDMFNLIIYALVFLLWVIWLNRFTDLWSYIKSAKNKTELPE